MFETFGRRRHCLRFYVQRDFLAKLFALCALQLAMCFATALVVQAIVKDQAGPLRGFLRTIEVFSSRGGVGATRFFLRAYGLRS